MSWRAQDFLRLKSRVRSRSLNRLVLRFTRLHPMSPADASISDPSSTTCAPGRSPKRSSSLNFSTSLKCAAAINAPYSPTAWAVTTEIVPSASLIYALARTKPRLKLHREFTIRPPEATRLEDPACRVSRDKMGRREKRTAIATSRRERDGDGVRADVRDHAEQGLAQSRPAAALRSAW
jgi:hypothetical protein